jgi:hypothetical protein
MDAASVWRSETFRQKNHNLQFLQWADYYAKRSEVQGRKATTCAEKEDYAFRDIPFIMQQ